VLVPDARKSVRSETNRRRFFLARGDYEWPEQIFERPVGPGGTLVRITNTRLSVAYGRILTLEAADDLEPKVLDDLGERPLAALKRSGWNPSRDGTLSYEVLQKDPRLRPLRAELEVWSKQFQLTDRWCVEIALSTLERNPQDARPQWFEVETHFGRPRPFYVTFAPPLELPPYDPVYWRRCGYLSHARKILNPRYQAIYREMKNCIDSMSHTNSRAEEYRLTDRARELGDRLPRTWRISEASERLILKYLDRVESEARRAGLLRVPAELRQPMVFRWLAGHQVCGWSPRQIAKATCVYKGSEVYHNAVVHGIKKLSEHIGLSLRRNCTPSPRGSNLDRLVNKIRTAMNADRIPGRHAFALVPKPPNKPLFSAEVIREALQVLRECGVTEISFPESGERVSLIN